MPPTVSTPAVPATISVTSLLRSCCVGRRREAGRRRAKVPGVGGVMGRSELADHQANGSTPAIESALVAALVGSISVEASGCDAVPGNIIGLFPVPLRSVFCKECEGVTTGIRPVTIGGTNCHLPVEWSASSNQLTVGGRVSCGLCADCRILESLPLCVTSRMVKARSKAAAISPAS